MEYYADITSEQFEAIREHETTDLVLSSEYAKELTGRQEYPYFQTGEGLKLYHPSDFPEALRVEILKIDPEQDGAKEVRMEIHLHEWMMGIPDDMLSGKQDGFGGLF